jgi:hypothetical protein
MVPDDAALLLFIGGNISMAPKIPVAGVLSEIRAISFPARFPSLFHLGHTQTAAFPQLLHSNHSIRPSLGPVSASQS